MVYLVNVPLLGTASGCCCFFFALKCCLFSGTQPYFETFFSQTYSTSNDALEYTVCYFTFCPKCSHHSQLPCNETVQDDRTDQMGSGPSCLFGFLVKRNNKERTLAGLSKGSPNVFDLHSLLHTHLDAHSIFTPNLSNLLHSSTGVLYVIWNWNALLGSTKKPLTSSCCCAAIAFDNSTQYFSPEPLLPVLVSTCTPPLSLTWITFTGFVPL